MQKPYISSIELAERLDIPASTIRAFRKRHGVKTKGKLSHISKEDFISNYNRLRSQEKMADYYNVDHHIINDFAKRIGFDDSIYKRKKLDEEEIKTIIQNYNNKSSTVLAKELNISQSTVSGVWNRNGLKGKTKRVYSLRNEEYFEVIDSQDKAYFLGFIGADGCLYKTKDDNKKNILSINIQKTDEKILLLLKQFLGTDKPIFEYTNSKNTYVSLEISSDKIYNDIEKTGLSQRKTYGNTIADVPEKYMPSLIRGYFDGDGSIGNHKDISQMSVSISGYKSNMMKIKKYLDNKCIYGTIIDDKRKYVSANDGSGFSNYSLSNKTSKYCFFKINI